MNSEPTRCSSCSAELAPHQPKGLCWNCALRGALEQETELRQLQNPTNKETVEVPRTQLETIQSPPQPYPLVPILDSPDQSKRFGDYELLGELSRGGMGVVYQARQLSLGRIVAVKMILSGMSGDRQFVERFRTEASAAAILQHPNIVSVHEVGFQQGQHYFSMDYVEGQNLSEFIGKEPLSATRSARYLKLIAEAIHYAHSKGILHRDLKPSNVLIDQQDQPRITDFGLAKRLDVQSSLTMTGQILGSPSFMPPEQAGATHGKAGRASDVYALGGILYFMLVARAPFQADSLEATLHQVLNTEPIPPRLLNPSVPLDLETICLKCLQKEPSCRYATAQEVADELGRFLRKEPIHARPTGRLESLWRWAKKRPVLAGLGMATAVLTLTVAIGGPTAALMIARSRAQLERHLYFNRIALAHQEVVKERPARALALLELCPESLRGWEWQYVHHRAFTQNDPVIPTPGPVRCLAMSPNGYDLAAIVDRELQLWKRIASTQFALVATLGPAPETGYDIVHWLAFSPGGEILAAVRPDFSVTLWNVTTRKELRTLPTQGHLITSLAFAPSGDEIATLAIQDPFVRVWNVRLGTPVRSSPLQLGVSWASSVAYSPDGRWLAAGTWGGAPDFVRIWDAGSGRHIFDLPTGTPVVDLAFTPRHPWLVGAMVGETNNLIVWDLSSRSRRSTLRGHSGSIASIAVHPEGSRLASVGFDREIKIWDLLSGDEALGFGGHTNTITSVAFSPDGSRLITAGFDRSLRLWETHDKVSKETVSTRTLVGHSHEVWSVAFHPDGRIFSASEGRVGMVWGPSSMESGQRFDKCLKLSLSPEGQFAVTAAGERDGIKIFDTTHFQLLFQGTVENQHLDSCSISPNGEFLVASGAEGSIYAWKWRTESPPTRVGHQNSWVQDLQFSPNGEYLASLGENGEVFIWDPQKLNEPQLGKQLLPSTSMHEFGSLAFDPSSKHLATGDGAGGVLVVEVPNGRPVLQFRTGGGIVYAVAFSRDGRWLATGGTDCTVRLWDAETGQLATLWPDHRGAIHALSFSEDGLWLASGSGDATIKVHRLNLETSRR